MTRVAIKPDLLRWARERARKSTIEMQARFPKLTQWENGELQPTLKQLEDFANVVHVPFGYLFLSEPPAEPLPLPDFRTVGSRTVTRPSPDLLDTIYACQERQSWFRSYAQVTQQSALRFVGSMTTQVDAEAAAKQIADALNFDLDARRDCPTWTEALRDFIRRAESLGVLVMVSGVVLNNNYRHLDPDEFRGFALSDELAPLVFINGADSKSAQMFTLVHELAHLWLGESALSDAGPSSTPQNQIERWCNRVAAELLAPLVVVRAEIRANEDLETAVNRLARRFKVSTLVILRRLLDASVLTRQQFETAYAQEVEKLKNKMSGDVGGGNFYLTTAARVSKRFARALVESTLEGRTLYRDAFRMLGIAKTETFNEFGRSLGMAL